MIINGASDLLKREHSLVRLLNVVIACTFCKFHTLYIKYEESIYKELIFNCITLSVALAHTDFILDYSKN